MTLIIAEKPSVANDIAKVIGATKKQDGYLEGNGYQVTWCIGHLVQLAPPENYGEQYKKWALDTLPILPSNFKLNINPNTKKQFDVVTKRIRENDTIICATDAGREGQLIFEYVFRMVPEHEQKSVKRLWISSMTDEAIREGFAALKNNKDYESLYQAARCRSEADWLIGMNFTRLFTVKYNTKLTVGRVQTPTLAMIVNRQLAIDHFKSEPYFELEGTFGTIKAKWSNAKSDHFKIKSDALEIIQKIEGALGMVTKLETQAKAIERPLLFDLTELQREANRRYGYTAQETLNIAQNLYETHKLTTYPRTDSRYLTHDMKEQLPDLLQQISTAYPKSKVYIEKVLNQGIVADQRVINDTKVSDHHAIIVTKRVGQYDLNKLNDKERHILNLIMVRLICVLANKKTYEETKLEITLSDSPSDQFHTIGRNVLEEGWVWIEKALLGNADEKEDEDIQTLLLPDLQLGQPLRLDNIELLQKKTTAPKPYTEATLLTAMENASRQIEDKTLKTILKDTGGLGTPATRAAIIEKLISVGYIERKKKTLHATEQGIKFIELLPAEIKSPELTASWEVRLDNIRTGKEQPDTFMANIGQYVADLVKAHAVTTDTDQQTFASTKAKEIIGQCPRCGKPVYESARSFYCSGFKDEPKCNFSLWKEDKFWTSRNKKITKTYAKKLLTAGQVEVKDLKSKAGKTYDAIFVLDITDPKYTRFHFIFSDKKI